MVSSYFSLYRLKHLFIRDFKKMWKDVLLAFGVASAVYLVINIFQSKTGTIGYDTHYFFFGGLVFAGFIFTSMAFNEAHKKFYNHDWLMLPASVLEKFIEKLLLYSVVYFLAALIWYTASSFVTKLIIQVIFKEPFPMFNPFDKNIWIQIGHSLLAQSVFFLGAAWFRKNNFLKTVASLALISFILSILVFAIGLLVFTDYFKYMTDVHFDFNIRISDDFNPGKFGNLMMAAARITEFSYYFLMAPVCWVAAFLKLSEVEVTDGI